MPEQSSSAANQGNEKTCSLLCSVLQQLNCAASDIISRSVITASFNGEERFDWRPDTGLRVRIPDAGHFVLYPRAPASELRTHLFPFPLLRGNNHKKAPQPPPLVEHSTAWWLAQLIFYGLPITADTDQAKASIKDAIFQDRLEIPIRLRELELRLRRLYVVVRFEDTEREEPPFDPQSTEKLSANPANLKVIVPLPRIQPARPIVEPTHPKPFELDEDSGSSSASESAAESSPISEEKRHLFTPNGIRITRPAEYPGLREREERLLRENEQKARVDQARLEKEQQRKKQASVQHAFTPQNKVMSSEHGVEDDAEVAFTAHKKKSSTAKSRSSQLEKIHNPPQTQDITMAEVDTDSEVSSLLLYPPVKPLKQHPNGKDSGDEDSVIFTGENTKGKGRKRKSKKKEKMLDQEKEYPSKTDKTNKDMAKSQKATTVSTQTRKADVAMAPVSKTKPHKVSKAPEEVKVEKTKKTAKYQGDEKSLKIGHEARKHQDKSTKLKSGNNKSEPDRKQRKKLPKVIEISSSSSDDDVDVCDKTDGSSFRASAEKPLKLARYRSKSLPPNRGTSRNVTAKHEHSSIAVQAAQKLGSIVNIVGQRDYDSVSIASSSSSEASSSSGTGSSRCQHSPAPQKTRSKDVSAQKLSTCGKGKDSRTPKPSQPIAKVLTDTRPRFDLRAFKGQQPGDVRDYTGCGITEMHGGLHPADVHVVQGEGPFGNRLRSISPVSETLQDSVSPDQVDNAEFQAPPSLDDSDFDLPSIRDLFSSRNNAEAWNMVGGQMSKEYGKKNQKQGDVYNKTGAVARAWQNSPNVSSWLEAASAHRSSPELSHSAGKSNAVAKRKAPAVDNSQQRNQSRGQSTAPIPLKRMRPTMIEIEDETADLPLAKRPRHDPLQLTTKSPSRGAAWSKHSGAQQTDRQKKDSSTAKKHAKNLKDQKAVTPSSKKHKSKKQRRTK